MKYIRKTPVEAIQWNGDNEREVSEFISHATKSCSMWIDKSGNLMMFWKDIARRKFKTVIPLFGWVVREGNTFQFYKDATFRKTFEEVQKGDNKGIYWEGINKTIKEVKTIRKDFEDFDKVVKGFNDVFGAEPSKETLDTIKTSEHINPDSRLTKFLDDLGEGIREKVEKQLSENLKDMAGSDTRKATFESVLDEMKELHAKKDKDYGSAFHKSFEEFGVTAGVVRLNDKMERVKSLVKNGKAEVKDESLLDSLKDMASYAVMLYVELKNKDNG